VYHSRLAFALAMAALAAILLPSPLPAQITFQRTYGGDTTDEAYSVQQTADGGYIVVGYTTYHHTENADVYVVKTDAYADTLWTRTFGTDSTYECAFSVEQTTDGGYIIAGGSGGRFYLIKTNASGDTLWTRTYGGPESGLAYSVQQTMDGGYIIAGFLYDGVEVCARLVKTDADGDSLWARTYGGTNGGTGCSVHQTVDSGYVIVGLTWPSSGASDVYLIKTNSEGYSQWTRTYDFGYDDVGYAVRQTTDSGYMIAGSSGSDGQTLILLRTDANGDTEWTRTFPSMWTDVGGSVKQTNDGGFVVAGTTFAHGYDVLLMKLDSDGDTLWTRTFGGALPDEGCSVQQTADGGYIIAGYAMSFGAGGEDVYLIKTDSLGRTTAVAEPRTSPTRAPGLSLTCEPNPFAGTTTIRLPPFALRHSPLTLRMYDSQGRVVLSRQASTSSFPLSTSDLPSGAYFVRLDANGLHATARLVLQR